MLPKKRIAAVLEHRPVDKTPIYQAGFSSRVASAVLGREAYVGGGIQQYREARALWSGPEAHREYLERSRQDAWDLVKTLDLDLVRPSYWRFNRKPARRFDENTFLFGDENGVWQAMRFVPELELFQVAAQSEQAALTVEGIEQIVEDLEAGAAVYSPKPEDFLYLTAAQEEFGAERAVPGAGIGVGLPYGEPAWLEAVALRPDLIGRYLMAQADHAVKIPAVMRQIGIPYIMGGGDFASRKGPFYSPRAFHELMLPALKKVSEACHAEGCYHMFASDGNLWPVAADLFGASGVDCYYEIDRRAGMDLSRLRDTYPGLTLMGGISSETLHMGTKEDVIRETRSALTAAKAKGSAIIGCSNQVVPHTPLDNFWAMMETLHNER
ncbi:MAG: hypothetical protein IT210_18150 [Armatimonadetes bacterium]|nr:hypothetical protein [Armatimonadota bacterium]